MKYYSNLVALRVFTFEDILNFIGNEKTAKSYLSRMCKNGKIRRVKRNLYSVIDLFTQSDLASQHVIASHITDTSFVSYHSAFEFYGFYNQSYTEMQISSFKKFSDFEYGDYLFHCFLTKSFKQIDIVQGVRVSSIERTIVDSINMLGKVMDAEELVKCIDFIHYVDANKIKEMLLEYDRDLLFRKVGYVLSFFRNTLNLDDDFFYFCKSHSNVNNYGMLSHGEMKQLEFVSEWGLYAYKDLLSLKNKGGEVDV